MIRFKTLTLRNFLSIGNQEVTFDLDKDKTTLIHGTNGSGKSTILDGITYSLFNKPFRKVNLPQLVNTQNKKGLLTEIEFSIGNDDFIVRRGQKPKVFEVFKNGEQLDSKAADKDNQIHLEQNILKLTYKSFTQVVILGSSNFVPFMQLSTQGRRECVEDFLDIKVFSAMSLIAKERLRGLKDTSIQVKREISLTEFKIDTQQQLIKELQDRSNSNIQELEGKIQRHTDVIYKEKEVIKTLKNQEKTLLTEVDELLEDSPQKKLSEFTSVIIKLENKIERLDKNSAFYKDNDVCHTCHQHIADDVKEKFITEASSQSDKFRETIAEARTHVDKHQCVMSLVHDKQEEIRNIQNSVFESETLIKSYESSIRESQRTIDKIKGESGSIEREYGKMDMLEEEMAAQQKESYALEGDVADHEVVVSLLKDSGIKTQIIRKYLPVMNNLIRKHLENLDFPIFFRLDEEFNESVSSPLHQDFSYASFSEGQKGRIDLALMFCWREICRMKNSVSTNLLVLDEVFSSSLDETGKDALLTYLRYGLDNSQRVLVVDHTLSETFKEKFDNCITVSRQNGFSRYD